MDHTTASHINAFRMPHDLPYPASPDYAPGQYGDWGLFAKRNETFERGYFTGYDAEPPGHYLVKDGHCWMSTSRLERESHAVHLKHARGNVVVCGVGMGMYLFNVAASPLVQNVIAVDRERAVMDLVQHATGFDDWPGRRKIRFLQRDAMELTAADIGLAEVDYLYVDIWPELGDAGSIPQTQAIQSVVKARKVGWWGQELDFIQWLFDNRPRQHVPALADLEAFTRAVGLPFEERTAEYLLGCRQAGSVFSTYGSLPFAVAARGETA